MAIRLSYRNRNIHCLSTDNSQKEEGTMAQNQAIQDIVRKMTLQILENGDLDGKGADAYTLSIDLKLDRANVSRTLNNLWKDGALIKCQGKPTLFLDRKTITQHYPGYFIPQTIAKGEKLTSLLQSSENKEQQESVTSLEQLTGASTSLKEAILSAKAAVTYPPYGLHTLLHGSIGVGKGKFAYGMYQYKKSTCTDGEPIPFVTVSCHNFSDNPKLFSQQLLGLARDVVSNKARRGFLDTARGGILFLDEIEYLSPVSLDLLASILTRSSYNRIGDTVTRQVRCMVVASTTCQRDDDAIRVLVETLPVAIHIPDLEDRGIYEKIELILKLFAEEAHTIRLPVKLSRDVLSVMAAIRYEKNIIQLAGEVKSACSRAYLDSLTNRYQTVYIHIYHLSRELLAFQGCSSEQKDNIRHILEDVPDNYIELDSNGTSKYMEYRHSSQTIPSSESQRLLAQRLEMDIDSIENIYQSVVDHISNLSSFTDTELYKIKRDIYPIVLQIVVAQLQKRGRFEDSRKHIHLLYGILLHITNFLKRSQASDQSSESDIPAASRDIFPDEYQMASEIMESLAQIYGCCFSGREVDYLASYFAVFANWISTVNLGLLVICHGESIASDLVSQAMKTIYGDYIIDYINYSSSMCLEDCLKLAAAKARKLNRGSGILILTDMEPLTTVNEYVSKQTGIDASILYPVTLPLLLETIRQILSNRSDFSLLTPANQPHRVRAENISAQETFIQNLVDKVIGKTTVFLDTTKAVNVLEKCLKATLLELQLPYSNEIAAKYLCHCCNMLERAIRGESWNYSRLSGFTNEHHELMNLVEHKLEYAENIFGIKIPASEIAYITEIFL